MPDEPPNEEENKIRKLVSLMRELGIVTYNGVTLGPLPMKAAPPISRQDLLRQAAIEHNEHVKDLLYSSGADPSPFMKSPPSAKVEDE